MMSRRAVSKFKCLKACGRPISTSPASQAWFFSKVSKFRKERELVYLFAHIFLLNYC